MKEYLIKERNGDDYVTITSTGELGGLHWESWCLKVWLALFRCHTLALMSSSPSCRLVMIGESECVLPAGCWERRSCM